MRRRTTTLTMSTPLRRGSGVLVDEQLLRVRKTSGSGPYAVMVRPFTRFGRFLAGVGYYLTAPKRWLRSWREARWDRLDAKEAADA